MNTARAVQFGSVLCRIIHPPTRKPDLSPPFIVLVLSTSMTTTCSSPPFLMGRRCIFESKQQAWYKDPLLRGKGVIEEPSMPGQEMLLQETNMLRLVTVGQGKYEHWKQGPLWKGAEGSLRLSQTAYIKPFQLVYLIWDPLLLQSRGMW